MELIQTTDRLAEFCAELARAEFVTVDTEFMRERTYWPQLCLVQLGGPDSAAAIDAMAPALDLAPLHGLLRDQRVLKVFHAARQDLEIFLHSMGDMPKPVFDTQVAAMVCGFGDQAAYDTLAAKLAKAHIDKSSRFTDWAARPLSERQLHYAISDVTHLRVVYEKLKAKLGHNKREEWLGEEMAVLIDPATYRMDPREMWRRLKPRNPKPRLLAVLREVAAWREIEVQRIDIPRQRLLRDEAMLEIAAHAPQTVEALARTRGLSKSFCESWQGQGILQAVARGLALQDAECPRLDRRDGLAPAPPAVTEMLKMLARLRCEEAGVAAKLLANADEIERLAADPGGDHAVLRGWRREIFGDHALRLMDGKIAVALRHGKVALIELPHQTAIAPD